MKKHAIIPIFIPHKGCPHDCIFCNQKKITAHIAPVTAEDVVDTIDTWLTTLGDVETVEVAFYGGSFTAIPMEDQSAYLEIARRYKDSGMVNKIHLSTRPDAIDERILDNLKKYGVDTIELGVQSFDDEVLRLSERGHDSAVVYESSQLIRDYGFELGIQLMIGLPGDSLESCVYSARETVKIGPAIARLYPTIVIEDTKLYDQYLSGEYRALSQDEAVLRTKEMYKILTAAGINIIRVGLKSSDIINENGDIDGGTFHPAFRQLVEGALARDSLEEQLHKLGFVPGRPPVSGQPVKVDFMSNPRSFSNMIGNSSRNKQYFLEKYPEVDILYKLNVTLNNGEYAAVIKEKNNE